MHNYNSLLELNAVFSTWQKVSKNGSKNVFMLNVFIFILQCGPQGVGGWRGGVFGVFMKELGYLCFSLCEWLCECDGVCEWVYGGVVRV